MQKCFVILSLLQVLQLVRHLCAKKHTREYMSDIFIGDIFLIHKDFT
jgi:hypothetical protein